MRMENNKKYISAIESALFAFQREKSAQMGERYDREMLEQWKNESPENYGEELTCMKCAIDAFSRNTPYRLAWKQIEGANLDSETEYFLAWYYVPSEEAARNGAQAHWTYAIGRQYSVGRWTGILGGNPSHFCEIMPPDKGE